MTSEDIVIYPQEAKDAGCYATLSESSSPTSGLYSYTGTEYTWTFEAHNAGDWVFAYWEIICEDILEGDPSYPKYVNRSPGSNPGIVKGWDGTWHPPVVEHDRRDARLLYSAKAVFAEQGSGSGGGHVYTGLILRDAGSGLILRGASGLVLRDE